eukprot:Rhum_TRINITY_DN10226_c0_g1::Rhum_TRINITY_DN10226_c0_g1_i1::g.37431::m.37431
MDIHVVHAGSVECVTVAVDASVAVLRAAVAECLCLVPECTVLAHEDGAPFGGADCALDVALCDVLCSDTVHVRSPSAAEVARSLGGRRENLAAALCKELREGRGDGGRAQALLLVLDPSHWNRVFPSTLMGAIGNCPTPAVLERLLASCGDCILSGGYQSLCMGCPTVNRTSGLRPWELRLCLRAGMPLRAGLLEAYGRSWRWSVPRDEVEIMLEEVPERCFEVGLLHGIFACGDDALLERCLALGALPEGALRKAVEAGPVAVSCAPRLVAAGCVVDADLVLAASQLGQVEWLQWLFDEAGCGVDVADAGGRTALHVAGSVAVVRFLAARGARPDLRRMGGLSVVHREPEASDAGSARTHSNNYRSYAQHDAAFAEVLATWPWLVHAEDLEGRTALRWMWERLCRLRKCWESTCTVQTIARSKHLVAFGANVQAMVGLPSTVSR